MKRTTIILSVIVIVIIAAATIVESIKGTPFAHDNIYGTWWFLALWAAFAAAGTALVIKKKLYRRKSVFLIHLSFLVILLGALLSRTTAQSGTIHLRLGESTNVMKTAEGKSVDLGFKVALKTFRMDCYPGTDAAMDYVTEITTSDELLEISMNKIGYYHGYRFMQSGYDSDMQGSILGVYHDPWGIAVTYLGYALLLISLITMLLGKDTKMRQLYRKATAGNVLKVAAVAVVMALSPLFSLNSQAQERINIDSHVADGFGRVCVLYNSRITPINTVAVDFVTKLCGRPSWDGLSSTEVFCGWVFDVPYWETVKMIEIKDKKAQELLGLNGKWASFNDFWDEYNEYKLEKPLKEALRKGDTKMQKSLRDADEKFNIVRMLYGGEMLKIFPYRQADGKYKWFAPGQPLGNINLNEQELTFVRKSMDYLAESIITGDNSRASEIVKKIYSYQHVKANDVITSKFMIYSEVFYNRLNTLRLPTMLYLALSLLLCVASTIALNRKKRKIASRAALWLTAVMLLHTSLLLLLRWMVSGHLPMSNGFETMQFMAWATLLLTLFMGKRFMPVKNFGPLLSSFALLVAMITDSNPQITLLMPVLQSPLLSVHVMVIMFSYALFGLMALIAAEGIWAHRRGDLAKEEQLAAMSGFLLYPAVSLLAAGIFIGAVWANVSWGRYWSWDSKEVWALITMLIYSAPLHSSLQWLRKPLHIHIYMLLAFLCVLMTYFGANYFLAGMHSYA